jgi:hypothetical protein
MLRGKILFLSLLGVGVATALLGLAQMWTDFLDWDIFGKTMITLTVVGVLISFLAAVDYDLPATKAKLMLLAAVLLGVALAGLIIVQLWWGTFEAGTFGKLIISDLVLLALISFILAVSEDFGANRKLRDEKYID